LVEGVTGACRDAKNRTTGKKAFPEDHKGDKDRFLNRGTGAGTMLSLALGRLPPVLEIYLCELLWISVLKIRRGPHLIRAS
jgi:hypothetical protein